MAAAEVPLDVLEQILIRVMDVKDIIRFKSVCKSWQSFISSPDFVKAHMNHDRQNVGDRRIGLQYLPGNDETSFCCDELYFVGSCNGLVCVSPIDAELEVANPWTREIKKLQPPPFVPDTSALTIRNGVECLGFGYDASTDDYKVIAGFRKVGKRTVFHVLTLKSNVWKDIGQVKYRNLTTPRSGVLCCGALHWIMARKEKKKVIISLDLITEEFKEIPIPQSADADGFYFHRLGVLEECLCIYSDSSLLSSNKWVMKNNEWELYNTNNNNESKYEVAHCLSRHLVDPHDRTKYFYSHDGGRLVPKAGEHLRVSMFVKSLVSPHPVQGAT